MAARFVKKKQENVFLCFFTSQVPRRLEGSAANFND
jgi:hypothetical protein